MPPVEGPAPDTATRLARLSIGVLRNPRSGANVRGGAAMQDALAAHTQVSCLDVTDPVSVDAALRELARRGVDTVAISGGDGTVHAVLDTIFGNNPFPRRPLLAVLRGGTANMTARDIGMRGRQHRALDALIEASARGGDGLMVTGRSVMCIDPGAGRRPLHGMFFGAAAIAQGIEYCKRRIHALGLRGEIGPAVTMARFVIAMARGERAIVAPVPVTVAVDDGPAASFDCEIVHVTTLDELVLGLKPYWGNETAPLRYTSARARPRHWVRALPGLLRGRPNRFVTVENGYESRNAHRVTIGLDTPFFVDGELFSPSEGTPVVLTDGGTAEFVTLR